MSLLELIEKCTICKKCQDYCSIYLSLKKYAPYQKLLVSKKIFNKKHKPKNWKTIYYCTKCEACDFVCPENIPITTIIDEARKVCVEKWGIQFPRQQILTDNIFKFGNPFGKDIARLHWLDKKIINRDSKTLLHFGCMICYLYPDTGKNIIKILNKLKIDFTVSDEEKCCGYFIYNTGNHSAAQKIIDQNMKRLEKYEKIITACAGCTIFLKKYYGLKDKVIHLIEIINEKLKEENINLQLKENKEKLTVIFHDSCHISRPFNIITQPREVLKFLGYSIENNNLREFELSAENGTCCGADGGMRIVNKELALEIGKDRIKEAFEKADILFTLCPFCINNFKEAAKIYNINIKIKDIFEELASRL